MNPPHIGHPLTDPGDGRTECDVCGKWVWLVTHSCKGVPVTQAARDRLAARLAANAEPGCTLRPGALSSCLCTDRPGCQSPSEDACCAHCGRPDCDGDCEPDLSETYPGSVVWE